MACCCPCVAGHSIGYWDDLGDASSFGQGDGRESDRHDTGVLDGLACLQEMCYEMCANNSTVVCILMFI